MIKINRKYITTFPVPVQTSISIPGYREVLNLPETGIFHTVGIILSGSLDAQNFIITVIEGLPATPRAQVIARTTIAQTYSAGRVGSGFLFPTVTRFDTTNKVFSIQWDSNGLEFEGLIVTISAGSPQLDVATTATVTYTYLLEVYVS